MEFLHPGAPDRRAADVLKAFERHHHRGATSLGWAPGRANLIGEHTDYNGGLCLPVALPHTTYVAVAARADAAVNIVSEQDATVWTGDLAGVGPGRVAGWPAYVAGVIWALTADGVDLPGLDLTIDSTVPIGAGLSSSAALTCATALALADMTGLAPSDDLTARLIDCCVRAETEVAGAPTGGMDQTVALLARPDNALLLDFADSGAPRPRQIPLPFSDDNLLLLVIDTRVSHHLNDGGYAARRADCDQVAMDLGASTLCEVSLADLEHVSDSRQRRRARHVLTENQRVAEAVRCLSDCDYQGLGEVLDAGHRSLRDDFEVSTPELDAAVSTAVDAGALAARMTGGGFGGSAIALVEAEQLTATASAVALAFRAAGHRAPGFLTARASDRGGRRRI